MADTAAVAEFKRGIELLRDGCPADAALHLRRALDMEKQNPYYLSFLGVSLARVGRQWAEAVGLCETAVRLKKKEPQFHLNLAEAYLAAGRRSDAVETLDRALDYFRLDARVKHARAKFGKRSSPILPFLDREHFVNRSLGRLRHRALRLLRKA
jgi:Flp pilus assembly protein TadD